MRIGRVIEAYQNYKVDEIELLTQIPFTISPKKKFFIVTTADDFYEICSCRLIGLSCCSKWQCNFRKKSIILTIAEGSISVR